MVNSFWDQAGKSNDYLLFGFGSGSMDFDLSTLHPDPVQILRLWQIYLDNVDPLLKITHAPSLQARIIDVAGDLKNSSPALEALLFSIYSIALLSTSESSCLDIFKSPKAELLVGFQFGCQQALIKCGFLQSSDLDCLTALVLYLVKIYILIWILGDTNRV